MSSKVEALMPSIKKLFENIRSEVSGIEQNTSQKENVIKAVCDYVTQTLTAESKSLLSSFYSILIDETLKQEPFLNNTRNKNKFYRCDIISTIYKKYNFSVTKDINYKLEYNKYSSLPIPAITVGIGIILSIALSKVIIIPVSLVIAGGLYYFISEQSKEKNKHEFKAAINSYLDSAESEFRIWFEKIEEYYNEQIKELIFTLGSNNNE
jgi:hypothetical protein